MYKDPIDLRGAFKLPFFIYRRTIMSWFKSKKELQELYIEEDFTYDPSNPYTAMIEEEFVEIKIGAKINDNKLNDESELPSKSIDEHSDRV